MYAFFLKMSVTEDLKTPLVFNMAVRDAHIPVTVNQWRRTDCQHLTTSLFVKGRFSGSL